jgi:hypothetical protein
MIKKNLNSIIIRVIYNELHTYLLWNGTKMWVSVFQIKMSIYISNYNIQKRNNEIDYVNRCIHYINISINHHCAYLNII